MALKKLDRRRLPLMKPDSACDHFLELETAADPTSESCAECGHERALRICLECGHVGCCEGHRGHATQHAKQTGHTLIAAWRGGAFVYCYEDRRYL